MEKGNDKRVLSSTLNTLFPFLFSIFIIIS